MSAYFLKNDYTQFLFIYFFKCNFQLGLFAFGALVTVLIVDTGKFNIGRLRPHFIEACRPNISCYNNNNSFEFQHKYHEKFSCTNTTGDYEHRWRDARYD